MGVYLCVRLMHTLYSEMISKKQSYLKIKSKNFILLIKDYINVYGISDIFKYLLINCFKVLS